MEINLTRRQALTCALIYAASLSGCCLLRPSPRPVCPSSPEVSLPNGALTIDTHCHVFNGTDLQIADFLQRVAIHQNGALGLGAKALGELLEQLSWVVAPSGDKELLELARVDQTLRSCEIAKAGEQIAVLRQRAYEIATTELNATLDRSNTFLALEEKSRGISLLGFDSTTQTQIAAIRIIRGFEKKVDDYLTKQKANDLSMMSLGEKTAAGMIAFVLQNLQYRYVSVHDYLNTYNKPGERVVDLMLPSMVDYDWWLAKGRPTQTPLKTQVQVMKQISILTGGRVHAFVPYDPLKQVAFELTQTGEDSLSLVREAIEKHGCVGVKLYPPMGFAALGNAGLYGPNGTSFWARDWLPDLTARPDLGMLLDNAMRQVLSWCQAEQVPVMAHSSRSNGVVDEFQQLAGAQYWAKALGEFKQLRVNFGHFGGSSDAAGLKAGLDFTDLMKAAPKAIGEFAYADSGYFAEVMSRESELLETLKKLYDNTAPKGGAALANRFMYGTDWEMTLSEGKIDTYLSGFEQLFRDIEARPAIKQAGIVGLADKFFGLNAVDWLGLHKEGASRKRLDAFYLENGIELPDWAAKIDV